MKKIFFDKQDSPGNRVFVLIMIIFLGIYMVATLGSLNEQIKGISGVIGFTASVIFFGKQFIFKYYLGWNKKGFVIKINSFLTNSYAYRDIKSYTFKEKRLEIVDQQESSKIIALEQVIPEDIEPSKVSLTTPCPAKQNKLVEPRIASEKVLAQCR
jgi:hypothetical protein